MAIEIRFRSVPLYYLLLDHELSPINACELRPNRRSLSLLGNTFRSFWFQCAVLQYELLLLQECRRHNISDDSLLMLVTLLAAKHNVRGRLDSVYWWCFSHFQLVVYLLSINEYLALIHIKLIEKNGLLSVLHPQ